MARLDEPAHARILRVGDYPAGGRLAGWLFDCMGVVPAIAYHPDGSPLWAGWSLTELRIVWAREHRN